VATGAPTKSRPMVDSRRRAVVLRSLFALAIASVSVVATESVSTAATGDARSYTAPPTIVVGTQTLTECGTSPAKYCGRLSVPLDYSQPSGPKIRITYAWYPAEDPANGVAAGTVVPVEGGPGFPSSGSVRWGSHSVLGEGGYYYMYGPVLDDWNMVSVDLRGTGGSTPLDCPALQKYSGEASGSAFTRVVGQCAQALDHRWKNADGAYIHASDLFTSVPAAADVAAVVRALGISKIDLYGDSYGSFFAQVFANHYPQMIRSLILDSTYQTQGLGPWYRSTIDSMPSDFDNACSRSPACAEATKKPAWDDIEALTARLRKSAISGRVPNANGELQAATMNVVGLVNLLNDAAGDPMIYRGIDAAARAELDNNDPSPLLRLYAQRLAFDEDYFDMPVSDYSDLLYMAVSCLDYPQLFDIHDTEAQREEQLKAAEHKLPASAFAPFTTSEWLAQDQNTEAYTACAAWPSPVDAQEPPTTGRPILPKSMHVLILGGEFDTWTPPAGVGSVMAELGGDTRFIELANSTHVVGEDDQACGSLLVEEFVESPESEKTMNSSCAPRVPVIDSVGVYPDSLTQEPPLTADEGNTGSEEDLKLGAVAVETAGDALARLLSITGNSDRGLHGGTMASKEGGRLIVLHDDVLVPGVVVSGDLSVTTSAVTGALSVISDLGKASLDIRWPLAGSGKLARITGSSGTIHIDGRTFPPIQTY
jgi:pimeloyl-ACP methyl ester carboxylesterase